MQTHSKPPIAVVAMSGVFPKATGIDQYWQNIQQSVDAVAEIPAHRLGALHNDVFVAKPQVDKTYSTRACLIHEEDFPSHHLSTARSGDQDLDSPSQWIRHACREAYKISRMDGLDHQRIGVTLAAIALPTALSSQLSEIYLKKAILNQTKGLSVDPTVAPGSRVVAYPATLISQTLGLGGGSYTLDAACASSLYAVKLACDQLQSFRCDAMISGGFSGADTLYTQVGFSQLKALSPSGRCAPFDHRADGLVVGEGVGLLVLKRLDDALRDNNTIYGIIHGIGLSNDMRGNLLAPESAGQVRAMQNAYAQAGWSPTDVDYIECHGAGTRVGDATELQSLITLWKDCSFTAGQCALGSIKSMIGHLLTGAGAAGMIKTLLSLHHKTLPPSLNFERPPANSPLVQSPFRVQTQPEPWAKKAGDGPRRAAVSAFGFGGINGHVLLEEWSEKSADTAAFSLSSDDEKIPDQKAEPSELRPLRDVAVVGMDVQLGNIKSLTAFQEAIFQGRSVLAKAPDRGRGPSQVDQQDTGATGQPGGFIKEITLEPGEFQIPPNEIPDILPQQLLMLKTALGAMKDAGLAPRQPRERMGAIIGISFDYEATNFHQRWCLPQLIQQIQPDIATAIPPEKFTEWIAHGQDAINPPLNAPRTLGALGGIVASRIAREFRFGGPSFVVSAEEVSGLRALEIGLDLLNDGQCDAVLVGAVDLHCDERNLATLKEMVPLSAAGRVRPFDQSADGTLPGEGAVALVLKRFSDARDQDDRIYAVINAMGAAGNDKASDDKRVTPSAYIRSLKCAFSDTGRSPSEVGYIESHGSGIPYQDDAEALDLTTFFKPDLKTTADGIAVGALKPLVGHCGAVSGLASVAKTALCLYHQILPPMPGLVTPRQNQWKEEDRFYFPHKPTYWAKDRVDGPRVACTAAMTPDGNYMHVVMSQTQNQDLPKAVQADQPLHPMGALPYGLFCLSGDTRQELIAQVRQLSKLLQNLKSEVKQDIANTGAQHRFARQWHQETIQNPQGPHRLSILTGSLADLEQYLADAPGIIEDNSCRTLNGRGGICYLPDINIEKEEIAFIYPGSGNHYLGMGRTLGVHFPEVMRKMDAQTERLQSQLLPRWYDPWRTDWRSGWQREAYRDLNADPLRTIFGQVLFGSQTTALLQDFGLHPAAVMGYSLGESAGLFALGAWPDRGQMLDRLSASDLFKTQLAGPHQAVRKAWHLDKNTPVDWRVAVINRPVGEVDQAIAQLDHVRRLIINTQDECVIGGLAASVKTAIARLGSEAIYLDGVVAVHCDAARPVAQAYKDLHLFDTSPVEGVRFYSVANAQAYSLTADAAAESIKQQALAGFDFPQCVQQAYNDGVRLFLEIGPHKSCTRMISRILGDRPHLAVAANQRNEDESFSLLKCLATLAAAGVVPDLKPLYGHMQDSQPARSNAAKSIHVPVGRPPLVLPDLPRAPDKIESVKPQIPTSPPHQVDEIFQTTIYGSPVDMGALENIMAEFNANVAATAEAHEQLLDMIGEMSEQFSQAFDLQNQLIASLEKMGIDKDDHLTMPPAQQSETSVGPDQTKEPLFNREQCMEFAVGSVGEVLGPQFDIIDTYQARVRLPDEPLMLVDRIMSIEGEKGSLGSGRIVTQHDVLPDAWYLDGGRAPVCISVEAGQADLFLSSYLGIDHVVKGRRTYRLLDATIVFHRGLPQPGETIQYDIHIDKFVRQGATYLFFFRFEGHIGNHHLITMTRGCAGFFTEKEVRDSGGIILTEEDQSPGAHLNGQPFSPLTPLMEDAAYDDARLDALRSGHAEGCFGSGFEGIELPPSLRLPSGRMNLINRVVTLQPKGGRFGLGYIKAEADVDPHDWFLTCHFVDDKVMPGTLMYECCAHTLRVLLLRLGWVTRRNDVHYEPLQGVACSLKCRGPVTPDTKKVHYVVEIKEIGYAPQPYVIADAHMYADGHYIVFFKDMSMQMTGVTQEEIQAFWLARSENMGLESSSGPKPAIGGFNHKHILDFALGPPSRAFGAPYRPFDRKRKLARLPGPPYSFVDRITAIDHPAWDLKPSGWVEAQYDVPRAAWYFAADRSGVMPFSVLLEIALQPCGWLAAYAGSALKSDRDLKFRNLGGQGSVHIPVRPDSGTLTMRTRMTRVSEAADMILEDFDFQVLSGNAMVFDGRTHFGFFTADALANQIGLRNVEFPPVTDSRGPAYYHFEDEPPLTPEQVPNAQTYLPQGLLMPAKALRMIDTIQTFDPQGGPHGLGHIRGIKTVDPEEWFFKAHFFQDPVCPGSLGVESFLQLIKYCATAKWPDLAQTHSFEPLTEHGFQWQYRGQIVPKNKEIVIDALITQIQEQLEPVITADGWLIVDGLCIYKMEGFGLRLKPLQ